MKSKQKFPKSDIRHWRERVERRTSGSSYGIHIAYRGTRERFNLETVQREVAASKAREIYQLLVAVGWEKTREKFKPSTATATTSPTLGEYFEAVSTLSTRNPKTISVYIMKTRTVVGEMFGVKKPQSISNPQGTAFKEWRSKVDATKLSKITGLKIQQWKRMRLDEAANPAERSTALRTVNSLLRNAKSLFGQKFLAEIHGRLSLPQPIPFSDVQLERAPKKQFRSILKQKGGIEWLVATARNELTPEVPEIDAKRLGISKRERELALSKHEQFKCLLLGLACGMRRGEIDALQWHHLDFENSRISIEVSEFGSLKTFESAAEVGVPVPVMEVLRQYMGRAKGDFVVESTRRPNPKAKHPSYRCQVHFRKLTDWLRAKGIDAAKPLHQLRGECATAIAAESGILAAAQQLRHSSLQTTKTYYSDRLRFALPEIGDALGFKGPTVLVDSEDSNRQKNG